MDRFIATKFELKVIPCRGDNAIAVGIAAGWSPVATLAWFKRQDPAGEEIMHKLGLRACYGVSLLNLVRKKSRAFTCSARRTSRCCGCWLRSSARAPGPCETSAA